MESPNEKKNYYIFKRSRCVSDLTDLAKNCNNSQRRLDTRAKDYVSMYFGKISHHFNQVI